MRKMNLEIKNGRLIKLGKLFKKFLAYIAMLAMIIGIFLAAPRLTLVTKDFVTWLYELDEEIITRFWTVLLSLSSAMAIFFGNKIITKK